MAIRMGLIGVGRPTRSHLASLAEFSDVEIVGVCDSDRARAAAVAGPHGASVHINFRTLLEGDRLDAAIVSLPPFARGEPEMLAARAGIHLFLEGPVALSAEKAREIQREIETSGVVASVACPWRYLSGVDHARALLKDARVALVRAWRSVAVSASEWRWRRESSGGLFVQEATELVDLARYLAGEVVNVCAMDCSGINAAQHAGYDMEDAAAAVLRFRSGAVGDIVCTNVAPQEESVLSVTAEETALRITEQHLEILERGKRTRIEHERCGMRAGLEVFLDAVRTGKPEGVRCDFADAASTLAVSLAVAESARTGRIATL